MWNWSNIIQQLKLWQNSVPLQNISGRWNIILKSGTILENQDVWSPEYRKELEEWIMPLLQISKDQNNGKITTKKGAKMLQIGDQKELVPKGKTTERHGHSLPGWYCTNKMPFYHALNGVPILHKSYW